MRIVARDWRELLAGSEGFLTGRGRAGCEGREVVWGEMVSVFYRGSGIRSVGSGTVGSSWLTGGMGAV